MKNILIGLATLLLIACALFWKNVWAIFSDMSVLEAMKTIITFLLHVSVATIAGYVIFGLPAIVKPWVRMLRQSSRRRRRAQRRSIEPMTRAPRTSNVNKYLISLLAKQAGVKEIKQADDAPPPPVIRLDF